MTTLAKTLRNAVDAFKELNELGEFRGNVLADDEEIEQRLQRVGKAMMELEALANTFDRNDAVDATHGLGPTTAPPSPVPPTPWVSAPAPDYSGLMTGGGVKDFITAGYASAFTEAHEKDQAAMKAQYEAMAKSKVAMGKSMVAMGAPGAALLPGGAMEGALKKMSGSADAKNALKKLLGL